MRTFSQIKQSTVREEQKEMTRQYAIERSLIDEAWKLVKSNGGAPGEDGISIEDFEEDLDSNLYKIWNRMTSGSYFPPAVKAVEIPKDTGGKRRLGIPTVGDRVAQAAVKLYLEPKVEPIFHEDSYGYRPKRSTHDALAKARERCWRFDWALEVDITGFFDNLEYELVLRTVREHTDSRWILLYVERWLKAPVREPDGTLTQRQKGSPQGSVISPLLSNIFMHHAFDSWMQERHKSVPFERYADDLLVHCKTKSQAEYMRNKIAKRLAEWSLELNEKKTRIVYCKDANRPGSHEHEQFDFLGYTFRGRKSKNKDGQTFLNFAPAISVKAAKHIREEISLWKLSHRVGESINQIAKDTNPQIRGWLNYFGRFNRSAAVRVLKHVDLHLAAYARRKYKKLASYRRAREWLMRIQARVPSLFAHWKKQECPRAV